MTFALFCSHTRMRIKMRKTEGVVEIVRLKERVRTAYHRQRNSDEWITASKKVRDEDIRRVF